MSDDILNSFGDDANTPQKPRASSGGVKSAKTLSYDPPKGPTTFSHEGPGLADHINHGTCGTQGRH